MDETLKLIQRIKNTQDGKDFLDYLLSLSQSNYRDWKATGGELLRGKALAFDELISLFENVDVKLNNKSYDGEWM